MKTNKPEIEHLRIDALIPYARNSRTHSDEQVAQIAGSIREFGFTNPVLIDADGGIIAGHGRVMAARKLGLAEVPCIRLGHLTEIQKRAYVIADNKLALNAGWNDEALRLELAEIKAADYDVTLTGFGEEEVAALIAPVDFQPGTEDDQGKLDELSPKLVKCPHCQSTFDSRGHEQS
jgi:ParB family chromosome partitioning protein